VTTRPDSGAAGSSLHAMPEAVTTFATSHFGLIGPFHDKTVG
jgi:hypothetical protein